MASEDEIQEPAGDAHAQGEVRRRDFLNIAAVSVAGVGGAVTLLPLINQMNPSADVLALSSIDVDLSPIEEGQAIKTVWRKQPVFIKHLTQQEIDETSAVSTADLRDVETFDERTTDGHRQWYISLAVCTHLGCIPLGAAEGENKGEYDGFFCPCHGSHYDAIGRIRKGPAPTNLAIPEHEFTSDTTVTIG